MRGVRLDSRTREPSVSQTGLGTAEDEMVCEIGNVVQSRDCWRVGGVLRCVALDQGRRDISAVKIGFLSRRVLSGRSSRDTGSAKNQEALTWKVRFRDFGIVRRHTLFTPRARERACARACFPETTTRQNRGVLSPIPIPGVGRVRGWTLGAPQCALALFCQ